MQKAGLWLGPGRPGYRMLPGRASLSLGADCVRGFCGEGAASPKVGWETRKSSPSPFVPPNPWASSSPPSQGVLKPLQPTLPAPTVKSP